MRIESAIVRTLAIVDKALRSEFGDDFDKRCLYAAFAVFALQNAGARGARAASGNAAARPGSRCR